MFCKQASSLSCLDCGKHHLAFYQEKEARYVQVKIFTMFQYPSNLLDLLASLMIQALISFIGTNFFVTINLALSHSLSFLLVILLSHAHVL